MYHKDKIWESGGHLKKLNCPVSLYIESDVSVVLWLMETYVATIIGQRLYKIWSID